MSERNEVSAASVRAVPRTPEDVAAWMTPQAFDEVECIVPDLAGVARGKAMPASKFAEMKPTYLPSSIFFQTITGDYIDFGDESWLEGDMRLIPDLDTLRVVPWAQSPSLQVIHDVHRQDGTPVAHAPRNLLKHVIGLYAERGWKAVVAPELEFYLTKVNADPDYPLEPPLGRSSRQFRSAIAYSISGVDEHENVIEDIYDFAEAQDLYIDTVIQEGGPAQMEINLRHGDPLLLADQVFLFKRTIREAAFRNGCYATFMAKPMENHPGSATHIHQSVVDAVTGRNVFTGPDDGPTALFEGFLAGQQNYIGAAMAIFAPYVNSYRRMVVGDSTPINLEWGTDNRSVGLRVPVSDPEGRRVENRVVGADSNPYLAIAASLACGYLGMIEGAKPRPPVTGNAYEKDFSLPRGMMDALKALEGCAPLQGVLGETFCKLYRAIKLEELENYMRVISPWEREHLLLNV